MTMMVAVNTASRGLAASAGRLERRVGMMNPVESPEHGDVVHEHMCCIQGEDSLHRRAESSRHAKDGRQTVQRPRSLP